MAKRPTIDDLAAAAGVSVATVDRVLNGRHKVREATAKRVAEAADWHPGDHLQEDAPWFGMAAWDADGVTDAASLAAVVQTDMEDYQRSALSQRRAWGSRE